tara:strand:+ start:30 stop:293 length:264 start_codon:yes stop_codon:yes gene_type:complete
MIGEILYAVTCVLWAIYATNKHLRINWDYATGWRHPSIVAAVNALICPVAIIFAIRMETKEAREAQAAKVVSAIAAPTTGVCGDSGD